MHEELVTYTIEVDGQLIVVEHVPARVDPDTGERFFAPETVERLHQLLWRRAAPVRVIQTPVFEYAAELI
jgi:YgiT-type zinc finger domain-containing protein